MDLNAAARRLDETEDRIDEVLAKLDEAEEAVDELADAYEQLNQNPSDDEALRALQDVASTYHPRYGGGDSGGVIKDLSHTIEELAGPADELRGVLDVDDLFEDLTTAFKKFEGVSATFTYANSNVSTPVGDDFLNEVGDRIEQAPQRLSDTRAHLQSAKGNFPDPQRSQQQLREAQRERELESARRMRETLDDLDEDDS